MPVQGPSRRLVDGLAYPVGVADPLGQIVGPAFLAGGCPVPA